MLACCFIVPKGLLSLQASHLSSSLCKYRQCPQHIIHQTDGIGDIVDDHRRGQRGQASFGPRSGLMAPLTRSCNPPETDWWVRKNETWSLKAESENEQAGEWFLIRLKRRRQKRVWKWKGKNLAAAAAKSPQSCPTLCNPIDGSLRGSQEPSSSLYKFNKYEFCL